MALSAFNIICQRWLRRQSPASERLPPQAPRSHPGSQGASLLARCSSFTAQSCLPTHGWTFPCPSGVPWLAGCVYWVQKQASSYSELRHSELPLAWGHPYLLPSEHRPWCPLSCSMCLRRRVTHAPLCLAAAHTGTRRPPLGDSRGVCM